MKMRKLHKGQRGFTLIEVLVVIVLVGLISAGITAAIMQVLTINHRASNHMIAVRQVQQAGKEVSKDTLQAQAVNATGSQGFPLTLTWEEWGANQTNLVVYDLVGISGEGKELQRSQTINDGDPTVIRVAQYIDPNPDQTSCSWNNVTKVLTFTVTATVGNGPYEAIETRIYEIEPRPGS
jgi:prepilin-type N-terminal cleavage/methylation domain-containing protein